MSLPQKITALFELAERMGGIVTINVSVPISPDKLTTGDPARGERPTARTVMWALNRLKAAPGQPNRQLVRKFLFVRGWIGSADEPEAWNLDHVPTSKTEIAQLISQVAQFEKDGKAPAV